MQSQNLHWPALDFHPSKVKCTNYSPDFVFHGSDIQSSQTPSFSGHDNKGKVTYEVWSFGVKCLQNSHTIPDYVLLKAIRTSMRGSAMSMINTLGENATFADILDKLDGFYGNVSTCET